MKKYILIFAAVHVFMLTAKSQDYLTRNGSVSIYSHTPLEDISAQNNETLSVLNSSTGDIEFKVAVKGFHFAKTAMEEHFNNPDYMDSEKFPKAGFKGKVTNLSAVNFSKDGSYKVTVQGDLTMKGITKPVSAQGTITVSNGTVTAVSTFNVNRKDFNVIGEAFTQKKIADQIQITVNCKYDKR